LAPLTRIPVRPDVLIWARETAGLDVPTAAVRLGVKIERVEEWEAGESTPTIGQVRAMADTYHRPLAALFMAEPIKNEKLAKLPDFRRPDKHDEILPKALQSAIMRAHRQRDAIIEISEQLELPPSETQPSFTLDPHDPSDELGDKLRGVLSFDSIAQSVLSDPPALLRTLVRTTESLNVMVIQVQRVDVTEMRGFSLGEGLCPLIALNGADWPRGKIYSLLHELAHVGFRSNGLCDFEHRSDDAIERKCDQVAAATLMPKAQFLATLGKLTGKDLSVDDARSVGKAFGASGEAAALRMVELGRAEWADYWRLKPDFDSAYRSFKAHEREQSAGQEAAPIFYPIRTRDLGRRFIRQVLDAHGENILSTRDVTQLLGISYDKVPKLARAAGEEF
jgi:Zn-dependent peptidase ImmA (M78 family)/transcriptional regulator with XRE-family HTH domain